MYPDKLFWDVDLYSLCLAGGVIVAMILIRVLSDKRRYTARWQNFVLIDTFFTVVLGYFTSVLLQAVYNIARDNGFVIRNNTGSTFYGGLLGGVVFLIAIYFAAGKFVFKDGSHKKLFRSLLDIGAVCAPAGHAIGRIGCLMAGCCYGKTFDEPHWFTFTFKHLAGTTRIYAVPVQLYEAVFLAALATFLLIRFLKGKTYQLPTYFIGYGVWRFCIEYLRDDYRGELLPGVLSPSQLISIGLIVAGIAVAIIQIKKDKADPTRLLVDTDTADLSREATVEPAPEPEPEVPAVAENVLNPEPSETYTGRVIPNEKKKYSPGVKLAATAIWYGYKTAEFMTEAGVTVIKCGYAACRAAVGSAARKCVRRCEKRIRKAEKANRRSKCPCAKRGK